MHSVRLSILRCRGAQARPRNTGLLGRSTFGASALNLRSQRYWFHDRYRSAAEKLLEPAVNCWTSG